jgi:hypothetical protein
MRADTDSADLFKELTELGLGAGPAARMWRENMVIPTSFFRSETAERVRTEGRIQEKVHSTLRLLQIRGLEVTDGVRDRVSGCADGETLDRWFGRALVVERAEDIFAEG